MRLGWVQAGLALGLGLDDGFGLGLGLGFGVGLVWGEFGVVTCQNKWVTQGFAKANIVRRRCPQFVGKG